MKPEMRTKQSTEGRASRVKAPPPGRPRGGKVARRPEPVTDTNVDNSYDTIDQARRAAGACTRCDLYKVGTQTVFGEGPGSAEVMFVGEQPGDKEDLTGRPFIGPAGQLLNELLEEVGIERSRYYVTNAVKHFKYVPQGKRRLHQRPNAHEIERCHWWLDIERKLIKPKLIVAMGATAARAVTGSGEGILKRRGRVETLDDETRVFITIHPSAVLRARGSEARAAAKMNFVRDLRALARLLE